MIKCNADAKHQTYHSFITKPVSARQKILSYACHEPEKYYNYLIFYIPWTYVQGYPSKFRVVTKRVWNQPYLRFERWVYNTWAGGDLNFVRRNPLNQGVPSAHTLINSRKRHGLFCRINQMIYSNSYVGFDYRKSLELINDFNFSECFTTLPLS